MEKTILTPTELSQGSQEQTDITNHWKSKNIQKHQYLEFEFNKILVPIAQDRMSCLKIKISLNKTLLSTINSEQTQGACTPARTRSYPGGDERIDTSVPLWCCAPYSRPASARTLGRDTPTCTAGPGSLVIGGRSGAAVDPLRQRQARARYTICNPNGQAEAAHA